LIDPDTRPVAGSAGGTSGALYADGATFVDSTVLGVLFAVVNQSTSAAAGETLALVVTPGSTVDRTIALAGVTPPIVATYPSRDELLMAWRDGVRHTPPDPSAYQQRG